MNDKTTNKELVSKTKQDTNKQLVTSKKPQAKKPDDTVIKTYCYILSTLAQRQALDLTKKPHKEKIIATITAFFAERLISVEIFSDYYILKLRDAYLIPDKRRLGRLLSENCDLKSFVNTIKYNNSTSTSGQLFRECTKKDNINQKITK